MDGWSARRRPSRPQRLRSSQRPRDALETTLRPRTRDNFATAHSAMPAFKVNETLSKTMSYKGDDGLSDAERQAYEVCRPLSGKHEACYKRLMYAQPKKQKEQCGPLMADWKACFDEELQKNIALRREPP